MSSVYIRRISQITVVCLLAGFGQACKSNSDGGSDDKGTTVASNDPPPDDSQAASDKDGDLDVDVLVPMGLIDTTLVENVINGMPATLAQGRVIDDTAVQVTPNQDPYQNRLVGTVYHDNIDASADPFHLERVMLTVPPETMENVLREMKRAQQLLHATTAKGGWIGDGNVTVDPTTKTRTFRLGALADWPAPPEYAIVSYDKDRDFPYAIDFFQHGKGYVTTDVERVARLEFRRLDGANSQAEIRVMQTYIPKDWPKYRYYSTINWTTNSNVVECTEDWQLPLAKDNDGSHTFQEKYITRVELTDSLVKAYGGYRWRSPNKVATDPWVLDYRLSEAADGYVDMFAIVARRDGLQEGVQKIAGYSPDMLAADNYLMTATSYDSDHGDYYQILIANLVTVLRSNLYNANCGTLGDTIKNAFAVLASAPASIQSIPVDLCDSNTGYTDASFKVALRDLCLVDVPPQVAVGDDRDGYPLLGRKNDRIPLDLCERFVRTEVIRNNQDLQVVDGKLNVLLYPGGISSLLTKGPATLIHAELANELKTFSMDLSGLKEGAPIGFDVPKKKETDLISAIPQAVQQ